LQREALLAPHRSLASGSTSNPPHAPFTAQSAAPPAYQHPHLRAVFWIMRQPSDWPRVPGKGILPIFGRTEWHGRRPSWQKKNEPPGSKDAPFLSLHFHVFFSVLEAHRLTLPHGLVARRPEKIVLTGCVSRTHFPGAACKCEKPEGRVGALPVLRVHVASMTLLIPARNLNHMGFFLLTASQLPPFSGHLRFPRPL